MNPLRAIYFCVFWLAFISLEAQSPNYDIQYFSTEDGLSSRLTNCVMEDSRGLIWVGTQSGLNRFDGEAFRVFDKNKNGLANNSISSLYEDSNGQIWVKSIESEENRSYSISIFNPFTEQAQDFDTHFSQAPFREKDIVDISSKNGELWIATRVGEIYKYDKGFQFIVKAEVTNYFYFNPIPEDEGIWYNTEKGILHLNDQGKVLHKIESPYRDVADSFESYSFPTLKDFSKSKNGYWASFYSIYRLNEIFHLEFKEDEAHWENMNFDFPEKRRCVQVFHDQTTSGEQFWGVGNSNVFIADTAGNIIEDLGAEILEARSLFYCSQVLKTSNDDFWLSTNNGLVLITPIPTLFRKFLDNQSMSFRGLYEINEEELFAVTYNGFFILNKETGDERLVGQEVPYKYGLGLTPVGEQFFIGFHFRNFFAFDLLTQKMSIIKVLNAPMGFETRFVYQDQFQNLWAAGNMGIRRLTSNTFEIQYPPLADSTSTLYNVETSYIYEDENGMWVCTDNGLFLINHQGKIIEHFSELNIFQINYLHPDENGNFWMTTRGRGLLKWNPITRHLQHWTTDDGLSHNHLYSIHEDSLGNFWIPSNKGLMRLQPDDFSIQIFLQKDGLPNEEFNTYSRFEDSKGRLFLGTVSGLVGFNPMEFQFLDKRNAPVILTSFLEKTSRGNEVNIINDIANQKEISFNNERKTVELEFALLDFQNSFQSKYAYKIEGYDTEWNDLESNRLRINRLPYGDYQLRIKGQGSYGEWSKNELMIPLHMLKPFYLKTWFLGIVGVLLAFLIYVLIRWRIYFLEKEKLALEKTVAERTQELAMKSEKLSNLNQLKDEFFAIIAHDLRAPVISFQNISKKIKYLMEKGKPEDVNEMLQMVDNAAENLNVLLDNLLNWALVQKGIFPYNPTLLNLKELSDETVQLFEPMAEIKNIEIQQDICKAVTVNADKDAVGMILRNLVSNALKFSSAGDLVKISAEQQNENVLLSIKDSGVGIAPEVTARLFDLNEEKVSRGTKGEKGSGLGLVLCKELVEMNQGNIEVESELGKGTSFSILLPVN